MHSQIVFIKSYLIVFISILLAGSSFSQVLKGKIVNNQTQEPVGAAIIRDKTTHKEFVSDVSGYFSIPLDDPEQLLDLEIIKENFALFSIKLVATDWNTDIQEFYLVSSTGRLANDRETSTAQMIRKRMILTFIAYCHHQMIRF